MTAKTLKNQMLASLSTLNQAIANCPDSEWNESHRDAPFSQAAFHTLFYLDYYLSPGEEKFKAQDFHIGHKEIFQDYEELEYKVPEHLYSREQILLYLQFCRQKTEEVFSAISGEDFFKPAPFQNLTVLELALYTMRHVQHHAAQLGLRIQQITGKELTWFHSGWEDHP